MRGHPRLPRELCARGFRIRLQYGGKSRSSGDGMRLRHSDLLVLVLVALLIAPLSHGIGSDTQRPFAIVVVASLVSRLSLGFFVNPVLYQVVAREGDVLQV